MGPTPPEIMARIITLSTNYTTHLFISFPDFNFSFLRSLLASLPESFSITSSFPLIGFSFLFLIPLYLSISRPYIPKPSSLSLMQHWEQNLQGYATVLFTSKGAFEGTVRRH